MIKAVNNFLKNPNKPASFYAPTFCISAKMFLERRRAVIFDRHTDSDF